MTVNITDSTIIRALIRKGTNSERETVTLADGELGYTTDTRRLFIGDGSTVGGLNTGIKFFGETTDFSTIGAQSPQPGDFFKSGTGLYARNVDGSGNVNDSTGYTQIGLAATVGSGLELSSGQLNVLPDNTTIQLTSGKVAVKTIELNNITTIPSNVIVGNNTANDATPLSIAIGNNSLLGRSGSDNISSITFQDAVTLGLQQFTVSSPYANNSNQSGAGLVNTGYDGRITWGGLPHLKIFSSIGAGSFTLPDNCYVVKVTVQGGGSAGNGSYTGNAGGTLIFYMKVSSDPLKRDVTVSVGAGGTTAGATGGNTSVTLYDSSGVAQTFTAVGGETAVMPTSYTPTANTIPSSIALGDVIDITTGVARNNNSKDRQSRISSYFGNNGYGSGGMDSVSAGDFTGKDGVVILEYYKAI